MVSYMNSTFRFGVLTILCLSICSVSLAEYPGLEKAIKTDMEPLGLSLSGKTVLVSLPDPAEFNRQWRLTAAIETEVVAQLLTAGVQAVDDDTDDRFTWLARTSRKPVERWQQNPVYDVLLTGEFKVNKRADVLELSLLVFDQQMAEPVQVVRTEIKASDATVSANLPPKNIAVADFVRSFRGKTIGTGVCATAATEALKHAECQRIGLYDWGRRLSPNEALLPGDIVQFEYATFKKKGSKASTLVHHTAIIHEIVDRDRFKVLHQNVGNVSVKKTITEGSFNMADHTNGSVVFFRPTLPENVLPIDPTPYRKSPAKVVTGKNGRIDLLRTVNPKLDAVHGIWGKWNGPICSNKDKCLKLQIPVDLPSSYVIRARIRRTWGTDTYAMIFPVDGHPCLLGLDAYGGTVSGLELISGEKIKNNPTTRKIKNVLPMDKPVALTLRVTPRSVRVEIGGNELVNWKGDPSVFSLQQAWDVPNKSWLHLGTYYSVFDTESLTMEVVE